MGNLHPSSSVHLSYRGDNLRFPIWLYHYCKEASTKSFSENKCYFSDILPSALAKLKVTFYMDRTICFRTSLVSAPEHISYFMRMQNL